MNQLKKLAITCLMLGCLSAHALSEGVPQSQFGVSIWPYRAQTPCSTSLPDEQPTPLPSLQPSATHTPQPTQKPAPSATPVPTVPANDGDYTTLSVSAQEYSAWNLLNSDRKNNGLAALPLDEALCAIARTKSEDMKNNHYFAHESPTYGYVKDMLTYFGYSFNGAGENIAHHATVEKAQAAFMSNTGHRTNILGKQWTRVGIGVCYDDNGFVYVTQIFVR